MKPNSPLALGLRALWRDARAGELRWMALAVVLAVAALCAVGFFADRLQAGLSRDARQLLGGDAVVASDQPLPPPFARQARDWGLQVSHNLSFPTMARAPDALGAATRLVALKAVDAAYPLRGKLQTQEQPGGVVRAQPGGPQPGTVWVDAAVLDALGLRVHDALLLGEARFTITHLIDQEPDRGAGFMNFAPRVMMAAADLPATGLLQPASRIGYRMAVAGADESVARFVAWAQEQLQARAVRGARVESLEGGRPEFSTTLERAQKFLNLVALLAALLSAVAVALAARDFANRHLDDCAVLRVLGVRQRQMVAAYALEFGLIGLLSSALGVALGWAAHHGFVRLLAPWMPVELPAAGAGPAWVGLGVGLTLLLAFGLPPVLQLARVPALRVIRRDVGALKPASLGVALVGVAGFAALLLAVSRDARLGLIAVGGFAAAAVLFAALAAVAVAVLRRSVPVAGATTAWALAVRQLAARPALAVVQISALAVGLLALLLLVLLRTDLIDGWRAATPRDAPTRFVINVMPEQADAFVARLKSAGASAVEIHPMIRGRLVAVNGRGVGPEDYSEERARRLVDREFNLSHSAQPPAHNPVVAGRWRSGEEGAVSLEEGIAQTLGLKLGDELGFDIGGQLHTARITSLRKVDWASLRANFFALFPVAGLAQLPSTRLVTFRAPDRPGFDAELVRAFPNITVVDTTATLRQVQGVLEQVIAAVQALFAFSLLAGWVVLMAAIATTREARAREYALMRAMGARAALLRRVQRLELLAVGALAGVLAAVVATAMGWALARYVFDFAYAASWTVPLWGTAAGAALAWLAGWWGLREVLQRPVVQTLRRASV